MNDPLATAGTATRQPAAPRLTPSDSGLLAHPRPTQNQFVGDGWPSVRPRDFSPDRRARLCAADWRTFSGCFRNSADAPLSGLPRAAPLDVSRRGICDVTGSSGSVVFGVVDLVRRLRPGRGYRWS